MSKLIFSQESVYRLHRLANKVRAVTGVRHKLSNNDGLVNLMRVCTASDNNQVKWQLKHFIESLNGEQVQKLIDSGVDLAFRRAS